MNQSPNSPALTVVICTYNNASMLAGVLATLASQNGIGRENWDCLVVDNNCTDGTEDVVNLHLSSGTIPGLRSVRESEQGLTPSRLRGVKCSTAPWIAFVDDDCYLQPDWIAQALSFAQTHPHAGAFGGRVVLDWSSSPPAYARAFGYCFAEQDHGDVPLQVPFLAGAGLIANRSALAASGWIGAPLIADRIGKSLVSGGDVEIVLRIAGTGHELWYVPQCTLRHRIPESRMSARYLVSMNRNLGISQALADALVFELSTSKWILASLRKVIRLKLDLSRRVLAVIRERASFTELRIQSSFVLGFLQGIAKIISMPSSRRRQLLGRARKPPCGDLAESRGSA